MRSIALLSVVSFSILTAACSDGAFDVVAPGEDSAAATDDGLAADTSVEAATDTGSVIEDGAADTTVAMDTGTAIDANSPEVTADTRDSAVSEVSDGVDSSADAGAPDARDAADTCVANACGGCTVLPHAVNSGPCGQCGGGTWQCDGTNAMKCVSPNAKNSCGGCATLAHPKDEICGKCQSGKYVCASDGESTSCSDPVPAASPAVGSTCGTCGTKAYVCNTGKTDTVCSGDDANDCGGCGTLSGVPNTTCGGCGKWTCAVNKASVSCIEGTPLVNTSCGTCGTSKYVCTGLATTSCQKSDDRTPGTDLATPTYPITTWAFAARSASAAPEQSTKVAATFKVAHAGSVTRVHVGLARSTYSCGLNCGPHPDPACSCPTEGICICAVPEAQLAAGKVYVDVYAGGSPSAGAVPLATAFVAGDAAVFTDDVGKLVPFDVVLPQSFPVGTELTVVIRTDSTRYKYATLTSSRPLANPDRLLRGWKGSSWQPGTPGQEDFLTMTVEMNACF